MQTVKIETAQNVEIEYEIANVGERILGAFIDYIIVFSYLLVVLIVYRLLIEVIKDFIIIYFILLYIPLLFYDLLCEIFMDGQSFGKKLLSIKVVKLDGSQPTIGSYLLRWILRIIEIAPCTGFVAIITILINGKGQRIGDIAAGTTVVRLKPAATIDDTILISLDKDYRPVYTKAKKLDDKTVTIIKEVLDFERKNRSAKSTKLILNKTKSRLEEVTGIKSDMDPKSFLETVLKDYNYFNTV